MPRGRSPAGGRGEQDRQGRCRPGSGQERTGGTRSHSRRVGCGENIFVNVSAITGEGIENLLESILLQAEILELEAVDKGNAKGIVVEASLDKGRGPGCHRAGAVRHVETGADAARRYPVRPRARDVRRRCQNIKSAGPSMPAVSARTVRRAQCGRRSVRRRERAQGARICRDSRSQDAREQTGRPAKGQSWQGMFDAMAEGEVAEINILVKADVQGSAEAIRECAGKTVHR